MDRQFQMSAYTLFVERYGAHITKFRKDNVRNVIFLQKMATKKAEIRTLVSEDAWQLFDDYIELMSLHSDIASKKLHGQGIKDGMSLAHFLDAEFSDADFNEIIFDQNERYE